MKELEEIVSQELKTYVPADITVININAQGIICTSIDPLYNGGTY